MPASNFLRRLYRTKVATSVTDFISGGIAWVAKLYVIGFTVWVRSSKFVGWDDTTKVAFVFFVIAISFAGVQPYLPKFADLKKVDKEVARIALMALAIDKIAAAVWARHMDLGVRQELLVSILAAIKTETESICGIDPGITLTVTLYVHEPGNQQKMRRLVQWAQKDKYGPIWKHQLLEIESLKTEERFSNSNGSLVSFPLISNPREGQTTLDGAPSSVIGMISIESNVSGTTGGFEKEIELRTFSYATLAKLTLVADEALRGARMQEFEFDQANKRLAKCKASLDALRAKLPNGKPSSGKPRSNR